MDMKTAKPNRIQSVASSCVFALAVLMIAGCSRPPSIIFLEVPRAGLGGIGSTELIRGKVSGNHRGRHIFLYAFADGRWWIQPFESKPRTEILKDGSWNAHIHLGSQYAAILSKEETLPPQYMEGLPAVGPNIEAVNILKASGDDIPPPDDESSEKPIVFNGLEWKVRTIPGDYGAKTNEYSSSNVSVDDSGALHLRLSRNAHGWVCSELHSVRSFGYGTYVLDISDVAHLEPAVMFSTFTFLERPVDGNHRELAVHLTRRGVASNTNAEFTIQPAFVPTNFYHFEVPGGPLKIVLNWHPDEADFSVSRDHVDTKPQMTWWLFKTGVPRSDDTHLYINLCNYGYAPTPPTHDAEVVVKTFEFYP